MTPEGSELLNSVKEAHILSQAVQLEMNKTIVAARKAGATWTEIGSVFGITKQAAWERFKDLEEDVLPDIGATTAPE